MTDAELVLESLILQMLVAIDALKEVAEWRHDGDGGFCFGFHYNGQCSCYVGIARKALKDMEHLGDITPRPGKTVSI